MAGWGDGRAGKRRQRRFLNWKGVVGVALSVGLLYYALRDVHPAEVLGEIRRADPLLFIAAITAATVMFVIRAWRWAPILEPVKSGTGFRNRFACVSIGFMGNNLLPARMGEFARAYALWRVERVPVTASLGSLVIERLFDAFTMVAFLFVAMSHPDFPPVGLVAGQDLNSVATLLVFVFAALAVVLLVLVIWPVPAVRAAEGVVGRVMPRSFRRPIMDAMEAFLTGIAAIRHPRLVLQTALWSVFLWGVGALSFWLAFLAFDVHVPFTAALFLQSLVAMFVSLPSAPGFFGLFEAAARVGLVDIFGVEAAKAAGFAVGFHMGGFVPITVIGLYYVWRLGISWREVERSEEVVEQVVESVTGVHPANDVGDVGAAGGDAPTDPPAGLVNGGTDAGDAPGSAGRP